jgi:hypothetical protein
MIGLLGSRRKLSQVLLQLRRALGITASSERRGSGDPLRSATASERPRRVGADAWSSTSNGKRGSWRGTKNGSTRAVAHSTPNGAS